MSIPSPGQARYFVSFKDDHNGFRVLYFMKQKLEVAELFKKFASRVRTETGNPVKTLRSDNGGEYTSTAFKQFLAKEGIRHETSALHTPQQNGVTERENRTIMESARSILHSRSIELELWAEAVNCAIYILNRVTNSTISTTPYEEWYGRKPKFLPFQNVWMQSVSSHSRT